MSSCQDYASRRPQEPWKYLDIFFAPPLVCSAIQCIIFCGRETRFQVARGRTLKGRPCIFFHCATAFQPLSRSKLRPHPDTADSSSLILHPCHAVDHTLAPGNTSTVRRYRSLVLKQRYSMTLCGNMRQLNIRAFHSLWVSAIKQLIKLKAKYGLLFGIAG